MVLLTPMTTHPMLAFLPAYRWSPIMDRYAQLCRVELDALTSEIGERYAREQIADATSGTERINRHWRAA